MSPAAVGWLKAAMVGTAVALAVLAGAALPFVLSN
jgi:hypothetical protein